MDELHALQSFGLSLPTPAYLFGLILFSMVGWAAFRYGGKAARPHARWIGLALMLYPYVVSDTWLLYGVGGGLCAALFLGRAGAPK